MSKKSFIFFVIHNNILKKELIFNKYDVKINNKIDKCVDF